VSNEKDRYYELFREAETYDIGGHDIHLLELDGKYFVTLTPGWRDGMTYEARDHIGDNIIQAIGRHEGWNNE